MTRPPPFFIADHPALDFLNTVASPAGAPIEWLASGADLVAWLAKAGLIEDAVAARFSAAAPDVVAAEARRLREWLRDFVERHAEKPLPRSALRELEPLNAVLRRDAIYREVEEAGSGCDGLRWREMRHWREPHELLQPIAAAIGDLLCTGDFRLVRRCEGPRCSLIFYDRTKSHARRWCSMAVCGNRAKAAAHRARRREANSTLG